MDSNGDWQQAFIAILMDRNTRQSGKILGERFGMLSPNEIIGWNMSPPPPNPGFGAYAYSQ